MLFGKLLDTFPPPDSLIDKVSFFDDILDVVSQLSSGGSIQHKDIPRGLPGV